jgi:hypothetical protein
METESPRNKVGAIYDLRAAVETKVRAERDVERDASPAARDALLAAALDVEAKTQDAIDVCHECGHEHPAGFDHVQHARVSSRDNNVLHVDFRPAAEPPRKTTPK